MKFDLQNKRVSILGAGKTGIATAEKVKNIGGIPFVSDSGNIDKNALDRLKENEIKFESGGHSDAVLECDLMILSPGVLPGSEIVLKARSRGLIVWPEIELAYKICNGKIIGVTGSNGKTTTTALIGEIFGNSGISAIVCGNIGNPFIKVADEIPADGYAVVELSSFQLEIIDGFKADAAVILNITPDHLDRHGDFEKYSSAKLRIFENQDKDDFSILNHDDNYLKNKCGDLASKMIWFSVESKDTEIHAEPGGKLYINNKELINSNDIKLRGLHNLSNVCAAVAVANSIGVDNDKIIDTLKSFAGVEHRLEFVRLIGGVSFINDSKGTNVDSVFWALKAVSTPVILIAGGRDKAGDFSRLNDLIKDKVKGVLLIGEAADKIERVWMHLTECMRAPDMKEAVSIAYGDARDGDTVLLSPGCASFDMYGNFEERGNDFKKAVMALK
ncbi:MAG: UDP-N-acetylmuramoyl-L-alanine--D-glutamate ligase [Candidatus Zixiibacteriota bacterium]|nr:MAG: UDP-N-acetylmuramoyl-L-alanine--D-glutamate ligase [candidate division Zixibacteria bacterium]